MSPATWIGLSLLVFLAGAAVDYASAQWSRHNAADHAGWTAAWSLVVGAIAAVGVLGMARVSPWLALPELAGYPVGSYAAVKLRLRRRRC
jgi:hypothetical protein